MDEVVLEQVLEDSDGTFFIIGKRQCGSCVVVIAYLEMYNHPYTYFEFTDEIKPAVDRFLTKHRKSDYNLPVVIHNGRLLDGFEAAHTIIDFLEDTYEG